MQIDPNSVQWDDEPATAPASQFPGVIRGAPKIEKPDKPNLPTGYQMGPNGVAERIPGIPDPNNPNTGQATESERTAG